MNVIFNNFSNNASSIFRERLISGERIIYRARGGDSFSVHQNKILLIAAVIFASLAIFYLITRRYFKANLITDDKKGLERETAIKISDVDKKKEEIDEDGILMDEEGESILNPKKIEKDNTEKKVALGVMNLQAVKALRGEFTDGKLEGKGMIIFHDGTKCKGRFKKGVLDGYGKMISNGWIAQGEFRNGQLNGYGKLISSNGCIVKGEFTMNLLNGPGKIITLDRKKLKGEFKDGILLQCEEFMKPDNEEIGEM
jgi:hypothetical protein